MGKERLRNWIEHKIERCKEMGLHGEVWAFQQVLKQLSKLTEQEDDPDFYCVGTGFGSPRCSIQCEYCEANKKDHLTKEQ